MRPGDILTALDGTTIEMNNSDAEGRLVLADCITWARREGCEAIVDIATLTGAAEVALGYWYSALMSNHDGLGELATAAGERAGERLWRLPLRPEYAEMIKGRYGQIANRSEQRVAGAITAAELLHHFAGDTPWAHLDIAGSECDGREPWFEKGGTGFGVRLLTELALSF
jgi:leucyl aminopeptidase